MKRPYFTLCIWENTTDAKAKTGNWLDVFGSYDSAEIQGEIEFAYDHLPKTHQTTIVTDGTAADMIAKRDQLTAPKGKTLL